MRQPLCPIFVVVAADDMERSIFPELVHNGLRVDIAAMDDDIRLGQIVQHLWPEQTVGVG